MNTAQTEIFYTQLADNLEIDLATLSPQFLLPESKWDSVGILGILALIDKEYKCSVNPYVLAQCKTPADIVALIESNSPCFLQ